MRKGIVRLTGVLCAAFMAASFSYRAVLAGPQSAPRPLTVRELLAAPPPAGSVVSVEGIVCRDPFDSAGCALETRLPGGGATIIGTDVADLPLNQRVTLQGTVARFGERLVLRRCQVLAMHEKDEPAPASPPLETRQKSPNQTISNRDFGTVNLREQVAPTGSLFSPDGMGFEITLPGDFGPPVEQAAPTSDKPANGFRSFLTRRKVGPEFLVMSSFWIPGKGGGPSDQALLDQGVKNRIPLLKDPKVVTIQFQGYPARRLTGLKPTNQGVDLPNIFLMVIVGDRVYLFDYIAPSQERLTVGESIISTVRFKR